MFTLKMPRFKFGKEEEIELKPRFYASDLEPTQVSPPPTPAPPKQTLEQATAASPGFKRPSRRSATGSRENPSAVIPEETASPNSQRRPVLQWAADVDTAIREAVAGRPLSILQADLGRAQRCLNGTPPDRGGAISRQARVIGELEAQTTRPGYAEPGHKLKAARKCASDLLRLRDSWLAYQREFNSYPPVRCVGQRLTPLLNGAQRRDRR